MEISLSEDILATLVAQKEQHRRISYADLAQQHLGDRTYGDILRSAMRKYKKRNNIHTILDPIDKLFGDPITLNGDPILIITDTHAPYQNKKLIMAAFNIAKERGIRKLIHAGDLIDGGSYNNQAKYENVPTIETEILHARSLLYTATSYFDTIIVIPGNHDAYYYKKEKLTFDEFICAVVLNGLYNDKFIITDYDYIYYNDFAIIGHLTNGYDMVAGKIAAQLAVKYNRHALVGHDHLHGTIQAENGKYGISIGAAFMPGSFAYKSKSYNTFPHSMLGFAIIQDCRIHHFDDLLNERIYE